MSDTIGCFIFTNEISGKFDTLYSNEFLAFLEDSGAIEATLENNFFKVILPLNKSVFDYTLMLLDNEYVINAGPEILFSAKLGAADPYYLHQYYLKNHISNQFDINVEPAWEITKGISSINIGILDDGVSDEHPDLNPSKLVIMNNSNHSILYPHYQYNNDVPPKYWAYDLTLYPWDNPHKPIPNKYLRQIHGTSMAGIIGADHNEIGLRGIAPNCKILPIKFSIDRTNVVNRWPYINDHYLVSIFQLINNWPIDVLNCSWYAQSVAFNTVGYRIPKWYEELQKLIKTGRNGRGTAVVACTGNERDNNNCNGIFLPAGVKINGIIGVGACNRYGVLTNYSDCGERIDLVAIAADRDNDGFYKGQDLFC